MKLKKILIVIAVILAVLIPVSIFCGNPVSHLLIRWRCSAYLADTYPDLDVELTEVSWSPKTFGWRVLAASPTSRDTYFHLYPDGLGNVASDNFEAVTSGSNTFARLFEEYRTYAEPILDRLPWPASYTFAELTHLYSNEIGSLHQNYGLDASALELDADYDILALGAAHGRLAVDLHDDTVTVERAAELLLALKEHLEEHCLPFRGIDFSLCEPLNEQGQNTGEQIVLYDFLFEDIYPEGMADRVAASWARTQAHWNGAPIPEPTVPETTAPAAAGMTIAEAEALLDFAAEPNWLARSLGCIFEKPEDIDLYYLFYLGVEHPGSWDDIAPESEEFLIGQGFWRELDLQIMPVEKMEEALRDTFGIELKDVAMPLDWRYIEAEDAYCSNHSDAYFPGVPNITAVEDDSETIVIHYTIDGFWLPDSEEFLDPAHLVLTLNRLEDGTIHAVSNVLSPGA